MAGGVIQGQSPTDVFDFPDGWSTRRIRTVLEKVDQRTDEENAQLLSVSKYYGVLPRDEAVTDREFRAESTVGYKMVEPGDLVVNIMLAWDGALGISKNEGVVSPSYEVYRTGGDVDSKFINYLLRSELYQYEFARHSTGIIPSRWRLYKSQFFSIEIPYPPKEVQHRIAAFLNEYTSQIDKLLEKKESLLDLLEEKRESEITRSVTEGLEPEKEMVDSGIHLIENIPRGWSTTKLKYISSAIIDSEHSTAPEKPQGDFHIIRTSDVRDGHLKLEQTQKTDEEVYNKWTKRGEPSKGDLIFTREAPVGEVGVVPEDDKVLLGQRTVLIKPDQSKIKPQFLCYTLQSDVVNRYIESSSQGSTVDHLNLSDLRNIPVIIPPLSVQEDIVNHIQEEEEIMNDLSQRVTDAISLLKEKRESVITAAVTGQLNINDWELIAEEEITV